VYGPKDIASKISQDEILRFLCAGTFPTWQDIRDFTHHNHDLIKQSLIQTYKLAYEYGLRTAADDPANCEQDKLKGVNDPTPVEIELQFAGAAETQIEQAAHSDSVALEMWRSSSHSSVGLRDVNGGNAEARRNILRPSAQPPRLVAGARALSRTNVSTAQTHPQNSKASFAHQHPCGLKSALRRSRCDYAKHGRRRTEQASGPRYPKLNFQTRSERLFRILCVLGGLCVTFFCLN